MKSCDETSPPRSALGLELAAIDLRILAAIWTAAASSADSQDARLAGLEQLAAIDSRILAAIWTAAASSADSQDGD